MNTIKTLVAPTEAKATLDSPVKETRTVMRQYERQRDTAEDLKIVLGRQLIKLRDAPSYGVQ